MVVPNPSRSSDLNRYAYAANNPLSLIDPNGHQIQPPSTCGGICYTGTNGPYASTTPAMAAPSVQPLTVGTSYTKKDSYIGVESGQPDDGVLLQYSIPSDTSIRVETGGRISTETPVISASGEGRQVWNINGNGTVDSHQEGASIYGPSARLPIGGVSLNHETTTSGEQAVGISGDFMGIGVSAQKSVNGPGAQFMAGWEAKAAGPFIRGGLESKGGVSKWFVTSASYLNQVGGTTGFGKRHMPGATLTYEHRYHGYYYQGKWFSGLGLARDAAGPSWYNFDYEEEP
jgi:hypothetical protein